MQRCIHPEDDITGRRLDDPEHRWSYLVFLQVLGKYLDYKVGLGETDYCFHYARESLLHYAGWMVENEVPYKEVLHKVEIPTETWPAHDVRKCHVLHLAARYGRPADCQKYSERAGFFFDRCMEDLLSFETALLSQASCDPHRLWVCSFVFSKRKDAAAVFPAIPITLAIPKSFCRKEPVSRPALPAGPGLAADWLPEPSWANCTVSGTE